MKLLFFIFFTTLAFYNQPVYSQLPSFSKVAFFKDESPLAATLETTWSKFLKARRRPGLSTSARFYCILPDSTMVNETVELEVRGHFRKDYCYLPPLKIKFQKTDTSVMHPLKSLKLVSSCGLIGTYQQYLLKEFIIYKIYNLLTKKSFRVRLLDLTYADSRAKKDEFTRPAFLIEDATDMAKRNDCKEWKKGKLYTEATNRNHMTLVAIFEYMIGNTDWSVPAEHNIKLVQLKEDTLSRPYAVPYDFDYCGLVNADYAIPDPILNSVSVQERIYRGYPREKAEVEAVLDLLTKQKDSIYSLINNFDLLSAVSKKNMTRYLDEFYELIKKPKMVKTIFIDNARTD